LTAASEEERRTGWEGTSKATFLMVDATPLRRMAETCSVKTMSLVRGMRES